MMQINPKAKTVTYALDRLELAESAINEIERVAIESDGVSGDSAREIVTVLRYVREALCLKAGITRHAKFAPELQK